MKKPVQGLAQENRVLPRVRFVENLNLNGRRREEPISAIIYDGENMKF